MKHFYSALYVIFVISIFLLNTFSSCEYDPVGTNDVEIDTKIKYQSEVTLSSSPDFKELWGYAKINYLLKFEKRYLKQANIYLGEKFIGTSNYSDGYFNLDTEKYENGKYTVYFYCTTTSGTGSMADIFKLEEVKDTVKWEITISNVAPSPINIKSVERVNGYVKIVWEKYTHSNFQSYNFRCYSQYYNNWANITDPDSCFFIDTDYLGGEVKYEVEVITANGSSKSAYKIVNDPLPELLSIEKLGEGCVKIKWTKPINYNVFSYYNLHKQIPSNVYDSYNYKITSINDTFFVDSCKFGDESNYTLNTISTNYHYFSSSVKLNYFEGERFGFNHVYYNQNENCYYGLYGREEGIYKLDAQSLDTLYSHINQGKYIISPDCRYIYRLSGNNIVQIDPSTLQSIKYYSVEELWKENFYPEYIAVSNNNKLVVITGSYSKYTSQLFFIDLNTNETDHLTLSGAYLTHIAINSKGDRIFWGNNSYDIIDNKLIKINRKGSLNFSFDSKDGSIYALRGTYLKGYGLYFYKCSDNSLLSFVNLGEQDRVGNIDYSTDNFCITINGKLNVYHLTPNGTTEILKSIKVEGSTYGYVSHNRIFYNGYTKTIFNN